MAVLGLRFCARAFSSCGKRGPLFIAVRGPLTIVASLVAEHRLQTCRLSSCGSRAQLLHGMWDLPRLGLEPVSPALAGGFSTTAPPGKPWYLIFCQIKLKWSRELTCQIERRCIATWCHYRMLVLHHLTCWLIKVAAKSFWPGSQDILTSPLQAVIIWGLCSLSVCSPTCPCCILQ